MHIDSQTLFLANATILTVVAFAFAAAYHSQERAAHWLSWMAANLVLAVALVIFMLEPFLPPFVIGTVAHGLLFLGFGLRLKAAREFAGGTIGSLPVYLPTLAFVALTGLPVMYAYPALTYTIANFGLATVTGLVLYEFWKDRGDRLPSRYGLFFVYAIMAASFGFRGFQGLFTGASFEELLPKDGVLIAHLVVALIHTVGAGAFAISLAYERNAETLRKDARSDALTGLTNRRGFEEHVRALLSGAGRQPFSLILFDVDHFKAVNDLHGHATGDTALRACADILKRHARPGDVVARIGGEEFAAVLDGNSEAQARAIAEKVRIALISAGVASSAGPVKLTVSAGITHSDAHSDDFDAVMRKADAALYRAKHKGRNRTETASGGQAAA